MKKTLKPRKKHKKRTMRGGNMSKKLSRPKPHTEPKPEPIKASQVQLKKVQDDIINHINELYEKKCPSGHWWKTNARCVEDNFRITAALIIVHLFESQAAAVRPEDTEKIKKFKDNWNNILFADFIESYRITDYESLKRYYDVKKDKWNEWQSTWNVRKSTEKVRESKREKWRNAKKMLQKMIIEMEEAEYINWEKTQKLKKYKQDEEVSRAEVENLPQEPQEPQLFRFLENMKKLYENISNREALLNIIIEIGSCKSWNCSTNEINKLIKIINISNYAPAISVPATYAPVTSTPGNSAPVTSTPAISAPVKSTPAISVPATFAPANQKPITAKYYKNIKDNEHRPFGIYEKKSLRDNKAPITTGFAKHITDEKNLPPQTTSASSNSSTKKTSPKVSSKPASIPSRKSYSNLSPNASPPNASSDAHKKTRKVRKVKKVNKSLGRETRASLLRAAHIAKNKLKN